MADLPDEPETRREIYLNAIATGNPSDLPEPVTREEIYLAYIAVNGGGGSGGTTDYERLVNKPKINGIELVGDQSADELGMESLTAEQKTALLNLL